MAPSISNDRDVDVAGSASEGAAPAKGENREELGHDPTVEGGNSLMWSEGTEPVSTAGLYIVTSDYDSGADESAEPSPCSRPRSEADYSVCSSSADPEFPAQVFVPFVPTAVGVHDQCDLQHLQFGLQGDIIYMYPPPPACNAPVTQGVMPMPYVGMPGQMLNGQMHQMPYSAGPMYAPPQPATQFVHQAHMTNNQSPVPAMSPQQGPQMIVPQQAEFQSPAPDVMYQTPPPTVSPMGPMSADLADNKKMSVATMPMPTPLGQDQEMSVGTRNGPMVLFATAPGASESTIDVPGMSTYPDSVSQQMQIVWHGEFDRNFAALNPDQWVLKPTDEPPEDKNHWHLFKDSAKVRFMCHGCGNAWTSMKGRCMFWIHLDQNERLGGVLFKLYGQACSKCGSDDEPTFCPAMWYPEEVVKVVGNVFNRVGQLYYGFHTPSLRIDRRHGKPREHHNAKRCQACREGVCRFEWVFS